MYLRFTYNFIIFIATSDSTVIDDITDLETGIYLNFLINQETHLINGTSIALWNKQMSDLS